eukprot:gb/GECG01006146.1/.p1 GENE.gb/GECG01006146.1/~~gb/GECG01006146.1/.p1  ORF type:complete len:109 (+),score=24.83 gb/GECG01006146.1/:1-327(+)
MSAQGKRKSEGKGRSSKGGKRTGAAASVEPDTVVALYEQLLKEAAEERKEDGEEGEYRRDDDLDVYGIFKLAEKLETSPQEDVRSCKHGYVFEHPNNGSLGKMGRLIF